MTWLNLIEGVVNHGDIEGAITKYRMLVKKLPRVRLPLARLLIARNLNRPPAERDWREVEALIRDAGKNAPESVELVGLRADMLAGQGKLATARDEFEKAKSSFPKSAEIWIGQAGVMVLEGRVDDALRLLDQAQAKLGDLVDLRLKRAQLSAQRRRRGLRSLPF